MTEPTFCGCMQSDKFNLLTAGLLFCVLLWPISASSQVSVDSEQPAEADQSSDELGIFEAHRPNYLVFSSTPDASELAAYQGPENTVGDLQNTEVQFQLSIRFPLKENFLFEGSGLHAGFTLKSFWQIFNEDISRPFRESNYEPEIFWQVPGISPEKLSFFGMENRANDIVLINHNSNGQAASRSRSWNRSMLVSHWEANKYAAKFKIWERWPEANTAELPDENPNIEQYIGNFEFLASRKYGERHNLSLLIRDNFSGDNGGSFELSYSLPAKVTDVDIVIKYFDGYGESLVDYDRKVRRFSLGIQVSDWF